MTDKDEVAEVERIYRQYFRDYPLQLLTKGKPIDFDALGFWAFPLMIVGEVITIFDRQSYDKLFRDLYDRYREDGWAGRVDIDTVEIHMPCAGLAVLDGSGTRYRADGSVIDRFDSCYILHKAGGRWQTSLVVNAGRPRPSPEQWEKWIRSAFGAGACFLPAPAAGQPK